MIFLSQKENALQMVRGSTQVLQIHVQAPDGRPYVLMEGDVIRFGIKDSECTGGYFVKKESRELHNGTTQITIDPEDTIDMELGRYRYDIGLQSGDAYFPIVKYSDFLLEPNVTWKE